MPTSEIDTLVKQLDSLSRKKRQSAYDYIRDLPDERAIEIIATICERRPAPGAVLKRTVCNLYSAVFIVSFVFLIIMFLSASQSEKAVLPSFLVGLCLIFRFTHRANLLYLHHQLYLQLPRYQDARFAVYALKLFPNSYGSAELALKKSLERNLPLLTKEMAQALPSSERMTLRGQVLLSHPKLDVVVLETLSRIEDTAAMPMITRMFRHEKDEIVKKAAEACLATLREVQKAEKEHKILLRPSQESGAEKTLLRVPQDGNSTDTKDKQELLRPESEPQDE